MTIIIRRPRTRQPEIQPTLAGWLPAGSRIFFGSTPNRLIGSSYSPTIYTGASFSAGSFGRGLRLTNTNGARLKIADSQADILTDSTQGTIAIIRQCLDTTIRQNTLFGSVGGGFVQAHVPWDDGNVLYDWGGSSNRIAGAYGAKHTRPEVLIFVNGPAGGNRVIRDGRVLASGAWVGGASGTNPFHLGPYDGTLPGDEQIIYLAVVSPKEWPASRLAQWSTVAGAYASLFALRQIIIPTATAAATAPKLSALSAINVTASSAQPRITYTF